MKPFIIKVTLSYDNSQLNSDEPYRIEKLVGAIKVPITRLGYVAHVGSRINEEQAQHLINSRDTEVTVIPAKS